MTPAAALRLSLLHDPMWDKFTALMRLDERAMRAAYMVGDTAEVGRLWSAGLDAALADEAFWLEEGEQERLARQDSEAHGGPDPMKRLEADYARLFCAPCEFTGDPS